VIPVLSCLLSLLSTAPVSDSMAARIDQHLEGVWKKSEVAPTPLCDDATFLRRVSLDLIGRIPTTTETRTFLADPSPQKRVALVDRLLASPAYARHAAFFWRRTWIPQADAPAFSRLAPDFEDWIADRIQKRTPYDQMVREILTIPPGTTEGGGVEVSPRGYRTASEYKPENLAASTARSFLGVNLDCAQCHDHPFAKWTRDQFWEMAAFFTRPPQEVGQQPRIMVGDTKRSVSPKFLTSSKLDWPEKVKLETGPTLLADWVTSRDNPFFARNAVNRLWAQLLGKGLVEPLDDLGGDAQQVYAPILDDLSRSFVSDGFDLTRLTRSIVLSRAYQLAAEPMSGQPTDENIAFSRAMVRGLTGEQLYDSLRVAGGYPIPDGATGISARKQFSTTFQSERASTAQRSVIQALTLMNGSVVEAIVNTEKSPLIAIADAPFLDDSARVELFFLSVLSRKATSEEQKLVSDHLARAGVQGRKKALADIIWALVNTAEFANNH
jgi:hypothetical protein